MKRLVTVVTGGGRGIGAATCRRLAAEGHDVAVNYVRDAGAAEKVAEDVRAAGARAVTVRADTSDEADVERLFEVTERELGPLTGLVNNAAVTGPLGPSPRSPRTRCAGSSTSTWWARCCARGGPPS